MSSEFELPEPILENTSVDQTVVASNDEGHEQGVFSTDPAQLVASPFIEPIPTMRELEFEALKYDIQRFQQREPILVRDHQIIDGRARCQICQELNIPVLAKRVQGSDGEMRVLAESSN